jgi:hypothetical protein
MLSKTVKKPIEKDVVKSKKETTVGKKVSKNIQKSTIEKSGNKEKSSKIPRPTTKLTKTQSTVNSELVVKKTLRK